MRLQSRLFLATAALVTAVTVPQWWLHRRQVDALRGQLGEVATSIGRGLLVSELAHPALIRLVDDRARVAGDGAEGAPREPKRLVLPEQGAAAGEPRVGSREREIVSGKALSEEDGGAGPDGGHRFEWIAESRDEKLEVTTEVQGDDGRVTREVLRFDLRVDHGEAEDQRFLVVSAGPGVVSRVPIPVAPTVRLLERSSRQGLAAGLGVLLLGLAGSAVMARRVAAPLQRLAAESDALGRGVRGAQVPEDAGGEVGEVQRAFNRMSSRLDELERERAAWREREHLAQLGDIARGLAHTLRNPLNTLGLAVEELAGEAPERRDLVATARGQIRRIDRWLRSFLAVGAGGAAAPEGVDLVDLTREVVFEAVQGGARVELAVAAAPVPVEGVPGALRAAIANLVENAVQASPEGAAVEVAVGGADGWAEVLVRDRGPGLPGGVRERLWSPHVTTRPEGSGMGLYLARQLVVGMHGGSLELGDAAGGGTAAVIRLPLGGGEGP